MRSKQFCQVVSGLKGDCFRACIASITGIEASTMPNFMHEVGVENGDDGLFQARKFLEPLGLTIFDNWVSGELDLAAVLRDCSAFNPGIPIILSGWSDRAGDAHCVVAMDGVIAHDPSGAGLSRPSPCRCGCDDARWHLQIVLPTGAVGTADAPQSTSENPHA